MAFAPAVAEFVRLLSMQDLQFLGMGKSKTCPSFIQAYPGENFALQIGWEDVISLVPFLDLDVRGVTDFQVRDGGFGVGDAGLGCHGNLQ